MTFDFSPDYKGLWIELIINHSQRILDAGCGHGSYWWMQKSPAVKMVALDLYFTPQNLPENTTTQQQDILEYSCDPSTKGTFDFIVADHILEHVSHPKNIALGFNNLLKTGGLVHVGVPDCKQFTDRFYRLVHDDGGGHISQFTRETLIAMMAEAGFTCLAIRPWPESWDWFKDQFDWKARGIQLTSKEDIHAIAEVLKRELTLEKGYFYGWEAVFEKTSEMALPSLNPKQGAMTLREEALEHQRLIRIAHRVRRSRLYPAVRAVLKLLFPN